MSAQEPAAKTTNLIVVLAFARGEDGELGPAFDAREMPSEDRAVREARLLATRYDGVIAWSRTANPNEGVFGEPEVLFKFGDVPAMD